MTAKGTDSSNAYIKSLNVFSEVAKHNNLVKNSMPAMLESIKLQSKITRAKYVSLRKEGFSKDDALFLCK